MEDLFEILFKITTGSLSIGGGFFAYFKSKSKFTAELKDLKYQTSADVANMRLDEEQKKSKERDYYSIVKYKSLEEMQMIKSSLYTECKMIVEYYELKNILTETFTRKLDSVTIEIGKISSMFHDSVVKSESKAVDSSMKLLNFEEISNFSLQDFSRAIADRTNAIMYIFQSQPMKDNGGSNIFRKSVKVANFDRIHSAVSRIYEIAMRKSENENRFEIIDAHFNVEQLHDANQSQSAESVHPDYGKTDNSGGLNEN